MSLIDDIRQQKAITVVLYGDSWTRGSKANGFDLVQAGGAKELADSWATQLKNWIEERNPNATVINEGEGGWTTATCITNFATKVTAHNPDYVFFNSGVNDWIDNQVALATYETNLATLIADIIALGAEPILWSGCICATSTEDYGYTTLITDESAYAAKIEDYVASFKSIAEATAGVIFIDSRGEILGYWRQGVNLLPWIADRYHLGQRGHDAIFRILKRYLLAKREI